MIKNLVQHSFVGTFELRKNLPRILSKLRKEEAMVVTRQGKPAAVMMDVEYYLELQESIRDQAEKGYLEKLDREIEEARAGKGIPAEKLYRELGLR